jgi:phage tail P2-like protein
MSETNNQSLLPPNATKLLKDLEKVAADSIDLATPNRFVHNPDLAPVNILPWMAWAVSVDDWSDSWSEEIRRNVIKASVEVHRRKGTIGALKKALEAFNYTNVKVEEWFSYGGNPYCFKVSLEIVDVGFDFSIIGEIERIIKNTKNARSHLEVLKAYLTTKPAWFYIGSFVVSKDITTLYPVIYTGDDFLVNNNLNQSFSAVFISKEITTIYPHEFSLQSTAQGSSLGTFFITKEITTIYHKAI